MLKQYIAYLKNNPNHYWFKRKVLGYGWTPATKEGFAVIFVYILILVLVAKDIDQEARTTSNILLNFMVPFVIATALLIGTCYWKGEKPKWQWGIPKKDDASRTSEVKK